jgi:hypothetical protein
MTGINNNYFINSYNNLNVNNTPFSIKKASSSNTNQVHSLSNLMNIFNFPNNCFTNPEKNKTQQNTPPLDLDKNNNNSNNNYLINKIDLKQQNQGKQHNNVFI